MPFPKTYQESRPDTSAEEAFESCITKLAKVEPSHEVCHGLTAEEVMGPVLFGRDSVRAQERIRDAIGYQLVSFRRDTELEDVLRSCIEKLDRLERSGRSR